ncbi:MAG: type II secretion system secretin GspD [Methylobacter sp.]|nr:type II secretion system secretin GspD [Methylobacter sp.]MDP2429096.1 type II secretion system secretin GspD [Methylobacter sp.]MDP3054471.1 type II secretion system secretin GspD [Methylobacter sp.]MDP3362408.1 type II secretion system secretin GspD [Methylobacter sp.]MDZ4218918.1 type II secretion system secretin GspD [Methylobacter sp.]
MPHVKKVTTVTCWVIASLTLSGCELLGPRPAAKLPLPPIKTEQNDVVYEELQNKVPTTEVARGKSEIFPGSSRFVPETTTQHRRTKGSGEGAYSLNFDEADLGEVAKVVLSDILGQNYVLSPKVTGKVTLQTTDPLTKDELIPTLEMLLRMNNAVLIKDASIYHIEPASEALYSSSFSAPGAAGRTGYQLRVIPIKNVAVQDIVEVIKPLVQEKTILTVDGARNIMVVSGTPDELARVMDMVGTFDIDILKGRSFGLFPLAHVDPETIIKELEEVFNKKAKTEDAGFFRFIPIERLNAIMAISHQAHYLRDIESWVIRLDRANTATGGGVNVYKAQHVDAVQLADTLNSIFSGTARKDKSAQVAPGQKAAEITTKKQPDTKTSTTTASAAGTGNANVSNIGEVRIIADEANNSVIIVATAQEYDIIRPVINQLDVMPLQVLVDATIVSVNLTDNLKYGIQWYLSHNNMGSNAVNSGQDGVSLTSIATGVATGGFGYQFLSNSGDIRAVLSAEAKDNNINVISSPSLMVLNNQEASIQVGDEVPLRTSESSTPIAGGTSAVLTQTSAIQQRKTGVKLTVKPRVNANGLVIMDIQQSVERAVPSTSSTIDSPTIQAREINSSVAVQSGETIVLGGLIDENNDVSNTGIPWLKDIPVLGALFSTTGINKGRTELVVLITPRVVKTRQDARLISDEFKRKLTGIYEDVPVVIEN